LTEEVILKQGEIEQMTEALKDLMVDVVDVFVEESGPESGQRMSLMLLQSVDLKNMLVETLALIREEALFDQMGVIALVGQED
jgi:hypothetical protein